MEEVQYLLRMGCFERRKLFGEPKSGYGLDEL
jgi:hypothetical protein